MIPCALNYTQEWVLSFSLCVPITLPTRAVYWQLWAFRGRSHVLGTQAPQQSTISPLTITQEHRKIHCGHWPGDREVPLLDGFGSCRMDSTSDDPGGCTGGFCSWRTSHEQGDLQWGWGESLSLWTTKSTEERCACVGELKSRRMAMLLTVPKSLCKIQIYCNLPMTCDYMWEKRKHCGAHRYLFVGLSPRTIHIASCVPPPTVLLEGTPGVRSPSRLTHCHIYEVHDQSVMWMNEHESWSSI